MLVCRRNLLPPLPAAFQRQASEAAAAAALAGPASPPSPPAAAEAAAAARLEGQPASAVPAGTIRSPLSVAADPVMAPTTSTSSSSTPATNASSESSSSSTWTPDWLKRMMGACSVDHRLTACHAVWRASHPVPCCWQLQVNAIMPCCAHTAAHPTASCAAAVLWQGVAAASRARRHRFRVGPGASPKPQPLRQSRALRATAGSGSTSRGT